MATPKPRVRVPSSASKGDIIEIKTVISHKMESGQRKDSDGNPIPRKIINKFVCKFNEQEVFWSDWQPAISANPYIAFHVKATESGTFTFEWHEDGGAVYTTSADMTVS